MRELHARHTEVQIAEARAGDKQHRRGKLTARERIGMLVDPGSFMEIDELARHRPGNYGSSDDRPYGDGVVTGQAR
ncbi:MAG: carboxyl transferase domain-containing protein, partial [Sciscionella sp.]